MLKVSLPIGDDLLEIHHRMWKGKHEIYWNGEMKSRKGQFFTSHHVFRVPTGYRGAEDVIHVRIGTGLNGTTYSVKKNDQVLLGTWRDQLTYSKWRRQPQPPVLDLNTPPPGRAGGQAPQPAATWREEDLIV